MSSNYIKELEEEIKKTKEENDLHFNIAKLKIDKMALKENLNKIQSTPKKEKKEKIIEKKNLNNSKDKINNINLPKDENKNDTLESNNNNDNDDNNIEENINNDKIKIINDENILTNFQICQCCNKEFDLKKRIPFLLKCNHIFCKKCLENYFTDEEGIKCPIDGNMGKSINDIKILNLFEDKKFENENKKSINRNINFLTNKSRSNKDLIRNKKKNLTFQNDKINSIYDQIRNYLVNNNNMQNSSSTNKNKNSLTKKSSINDSIYKPMNKAFSFINISKIKKIKNYNISSHLNEKNTMDNNSNNSEYNEDEYIQNFCKIHPEQKITHFVEETSELICIHCAFNKLKNNPNIQIKEIPEKCKEYLNDLDTIIENNQKSAKIIQNSLNDINENKVNEEKKLSDIYEQLLNILITNRNNYLIKIEEIYQENAHNMNKQLEKFAEIIDIAGKLKEDFETIHNKAPYEFNHLTQTYGKFLREINNKNNSDLEIHQYNFSHDELNKVIKYLNNFADVKSRKKTFRFDLSNNRKNNITIQEINNNINYNSYNDYNNLNLYKIGINKYLKKNKINKKENINFRNNKNDLDIKNNSLFKSSNNKIRFKIKYGDENENDNKQINDILNNNIFNKYIESNNNFNRSISESINDTLNKYIASTNIIRDSLYNQVPIINFKNSKNPENNSENYKNRKLKENFSKDKLEILNKYKIPSKKNK